MNRALMTIGLILGLSISLVGCTKEDSETSSQDSQSQTEETQDYTATTEVKTAILEYGNCGNEPYRGYYEYGKLCCFYKDYNRKYYISLNNGSIRIWEIERAGGNWSLSGDVYREKCGIKDVGIKNSISEIVEKLELERVDYGNGWSYGSFYAIFQPKHGYTVTFTTENDEILHMRILTTNYTLDENESLKTVTIKYQLF